MNPPPGRRDLSALTQPPSRAAGLAGLMPPRPDPPARAPEPVDVDVAPVEQDSTTAPTRPRRAAPKRKADTNTSSAAKRAVPVYLAGPLFARLKDAAAAAGSTYSDWFLDAYERVHEQLGERFVQPPRRSSGLPPRAPQRRRVDTPTPVQLRLTGEELQVLERKRAELGDPSRSAFVSEVVELGLAAAKG